jgi:hypothetical protein
MGLENFEKPHLNYSIQKIWKSQGGTLVTKKSKKDMSKHIGCNILVVG